MRRSGRPTAARASSGFSSWQASQQPPPRAWQCTGAASVTRKSGAGTTRERRVVGDGQHKSDAPGVNIRQVTQVIRTLLVSERSPPDG